VAKAKQILLSSKAEKGKIRVNVFFRESYQSHTQLLLAGHQNISGFFFSFQGTKQELDALSNFAELWNPSREQVVRTMLRGTPPPTVYDFETKINEIIYSEKELSSIPDRVATGPIVINYGELKLHGRHTLIVSIYIHRPSKSMLTITPLYYYQLYYY
jgi:hypothetical protein